ncbi:hypothetical protein DFH11DRAFT_1619767 [Phellopilus nigrolimitatus]|nr:hypothetical protein DFH11DRAFT_1619767 [Phellopilus nigrolimitatus]
MRLIFPAVFSCPYLCSGSHEETHWIVPTLAGALYGFSTLIIFYTFLTDSSQTYTIYASSASACNTFWRSLVASIFPVASHSIISHLGTKGACPCSVSCLRGHFPFRLSSFGMEKYCEGSLTMLAKPTLLWHRCALPRPPRVPNRSRL